MRAGKGGERVKRAATIIQAVMGGVGIIQIILGILFWTGNGSNYVNLHMVLGLLIVILLWAQAGLGIRAGLPFGLTGLATAWGLVIPVLGMSQAQILPDSLHWIVQVLHLLLGVGALGLGSVLAKRINATRTAQLTPAI